MTGTGGEQPLRRANVGASLTSMGDVAAVLRRMLSRYVGRSRIGPQTSVNRLLGLNGDDAAEFLEEIHRRFGTSFSGFDFDAYFSDEAEAFGEHVLGLVGLDRRKAPLTFEHLVRVVEAGQWFEPSQASGH